MHVLQALKSTEGDAARAKVQAATNIKTADRLVEACEKTRAEAEATSRDIQRIEATFKVDLKHRIQSCVSQ